MSSADRPWHVLPKDLPNAVKHLHDEELDRLLAVTFAEVKRRGRRASPTQVRPPNQNANVETSLTRGQMNAVRAASRGHHTRTHRPPVRRIPIRRAEGADNWRVEGRKHRLIRSIAIRWRTRMLRNPELYFIDRNECLAVAQTLNEQAKRLSQQTKQGVPREFARVASDLEQSCGAEDFKKAWISIEWLSGCLNNFTKDAELGFCARNEGYSCALNPRSDACSQRR